MCSKVRGFEGHRTGQMPLNEMLTCSRTSPRYSALWKRPMTSPRISDSLSILRSFSTLPVMRYRKLSRSKLLVRW